MLFLKLYPGVALSFLLICPYLHQYTPMFMFMVDFFPLHYTVYISQPQKWLTREKKKKKMNIVITVPFKAHS